MLLLTRPPHTRSYSTYTLDTPHGCPTVLLDHHTHTLATLPPSLRRARAPSHPGSWAVSQWPAAPCGHCAHAPRGSSSPPPPARPGHAHALSAAPIQC